MKNRIYLVMCIFTLFALSLLSCPQVASGTRKVIFATFNKDSMNYDDLKDIDVQVNTKFENVERPDAETVFNHDGYNYIFSHWSTKKPKDGEINTTNVEFADDSPIRSRNILYAVYEKRYTVTLKSFIQNDDEGSYSTLIEDSTVSQGTALKDIQGYTAPSVIKDFKGARYTFDHWSVEEVEETSPKMTSEDMVVEDALVQDNITLYAVYNKEKEHEYTVTLKSFMQQGDSGSYTTLKEDYRVSYGTALSSIQGYTTPNVIEDFKGVKYSFSHWSLEVATNEPKTTSRDKVLEVSTITRNITLYAVYSDASVPYTVTLKSFVQQGNSGSYTTLKEDNRVSYGTALKNVQGYTTASVIEDFKGNKYTFDHWSEEEASSTPKTTGAKFDDATPISRNVTLYAVYKSSPVPYTVTLKSFVQQGDSGSYTTLKEDNRVFYGTALKNVQGYTTANVIEDYKGNKYTFDHWSEEVAGNEPKTTGAKFEETTSISRNVTLYAVYKSTSVPYTVTLKSFVQQGDSGSYTTLKEDNRVSYGTALKNVQGYTTANVIEDYKGNKYTFDHWSEEEASSTPTTTGAKFDDTTPISRNVTLYAVYKSSPVPYTITFKQSNGAGYEEVNTQTVFYGTDLNSINKPSIGWGGRQTFNNVDYRFKCWTDTQPKNITSGTEFNFSTSSPITSDRTFYAVYEKEELLAIQAQRYQNYYSYTRVPIYFTRMVNGKASDNLNITLQYRMDGSDEWRDWRNGIFIQVGQKMYIRGNNESISKNTNDYIYMYTPEVDGGRVLNHIYPYDETGCADVVLSGNVMSLLKPEAKTIPSYCFYRLFWNNYNNKHLISAVNLKLPTTGLNTGCYNEMFLNCGRLNAKNRPSISGISSTFTRYIFQSK